MAEELGQFKSQPWVVFDTIAARSFLVGENRSDFFAFGTNGAAINQAGEMLFFAAGRTEPNAPWYTSTELVGQLSYGFEAWQVYLHIGFQLFPSAAVGQPTEPNAGQLSPLVALQQAIVNFGVLQMQLGQEEQMSWPVHRFGAGGGFFQMGSQGAVVGQNSTQQDENVLKLPEPVEVARTQNLNAKIRLAPEALPIIGNNLAPGVGTQLANMELSIGGETVEVPSFPFTVQLGLKGKRVKKTQYGQVPA